jgi:hypothetical protein
MKRLLSGFVTGVTVLALSSLPTFAGDTGTISASVTAATPCITIGTTTLDFGTLAFSSSSAPGGFKYLTNASSYTNCAGAQEAIFIRGTDATSSVSTAKWLLLGPSAGSICDAGADKYILQMSSSSTPSTLAVGTTSAAFDTAAAGATPSLSPGIVMPCTGSSGAGEKMNFQYVLTASF